MVVGIKLLATFVAIILLTECHSLEEKELQCHRCYTTTCDDASFCNSTTTFLSHIHADLIRHTDHPCPNDTTGWQNPKYFESCHTKGSFCGKRVLTVTAIDYSVSGNTTPTTLTTTAAPPKGVLGATAFPILSPPPASQAHEYTFVMYSCTVPVKDCNKTTYSTSKYSLIVNVAKNKSMDFEAELVDEPKDCAKCEQDFCNKAPADLQDEFPATAGATSKFDASIVNILVLIVSFIGVNFCCDSMM